MKLTIQQIFRSQSFASNLIHPCVRDYVPRKRSIPLPYAQPHTIFSVCYKLQLAMLAVFMENNGLIFCALFLLNQFLVVVVPLLLHIIIACFIYQTLFAMFLGNRENIVKFLSFPDIIILFSSCFSYFWILHYVLLSHTNKCRRNNIRILSLQ